MSCKALTLPLLQTKNLKRVREENTDGRVDLVNNSRMNSGLLVRQRAAVGDVREIYDKQLWLWGHEAEVAPRGPLRGLASWPLFRSHLSPYDDHASSRAVLHTCCRWIITRRAYGCVWLRRRSPQRQNVGRRAIYDRPLCMRKWRLFWLGGARERPRSCADLPARKGMCVGLGRDRHSSITVHVP